MKGNVLVELPDNSIKSIPQIFKAIIKTNYFPSVWKVPQIVIIQKPRKMDGRNILNTH